MARALTRLLPLFLLPLALLPLALVACDESADPVASSTAVPPPDDPALLELRERAELLPRLFLERAPRPEEVQAALAQGPTGLDRLLGLPPGAASDLLVEIRARARALRARHDGLDRELRKLEARPVAACEPALLVDLARRDPAAWPRAKEDKVICQWLPYVAGLVGCAATANPLFYTACAIVVACNFCEGGWVSTVCGQF